MTVCVVTRALSEIGQVGQGVNLERSSQAQTSLREQQKQRPWGRGMPDSGETGPQKASVQRRDRWRSVRAG